MIAGKETLLTGRCFEHCLMTLGETHDESAYGAIERLSRQENRLVSVSMI